MRLTLTSTQNVRLRSAIGVAVLVLVLVAARAGDGAPGSASSGGEDRIADAELTRAELLEDIEYIFATLDSVHPNPYHRADSAVVADARRQLESAVHDGMSVLEFWRSAAPVLTLLRDGHTSLGRPYLPLDSLFPFVLQIDSAGALVRTDLTGQSLFPAGSRMITLNGVRMDEVVRHGMTYLPFERDEMRRWALERGFAELMPLVRGWSGPYEIAALSGGERVEAAVPAVPLATWRERALSAGSLTESTEPYAFSRIAGGAIGYIDFRSHQDPKRFEQFLSHIATGLRDQPVCALAIDLRRNGGGSAELSDHLLTFLAGTSVAQYSRLDVRASRQVKEMHRARLPRPLRWMPSWFFTPFHRDFAALLGAEDGDIIRWSSQGASSRVPPFRGPVFMLIGTNTFSAAADLAAAAKDHGLAVLVGQESGGLASSYGESYRSTLPHTRLPLSVSFKYFLRPAGYDDGRGVIPDVAVEPAGPRTPPTRGMDTADPVLAEVIRRVDADCSR
jgi:hypothetical protein